jgi:GT2 family glycosyltransferase
MLSIVVLIRNTRQSALNCLSSLVQTVQRLGLAQSVEFVVVDDASDPQHAIGQMLREFRQSTGVNARLIHFTERQHYTRGCAAAFSVAAGDNILFVSHDMIVTPAYVDALLAASATDRSIGLVRGTSNYVDCFPQHVIAPPMPLRSFEDVIAFSDYVSRHQGLTLVEDHLLTGDSMLIKRSVLEKIGVFDPRYYGYFGDIDFGLRLQRAGFKMVCAKGAWLLHEGAGYYKDQAQITRQDMTMVHAQRMEVVQAAYEVFRQKWDPTLPQQYSGVEAIDFARLRDLPPLAGGEYQPPVPVAPPLAEFL